jgi:D-sedoheptulose 7-phosphate isomerase
LLIAISGSGNSPNILSAVDWANRHGLTTLGLTGYDGGKLRQMAQHGLHVPLDDMGMVESLHLAVFHWVLNDVYARINQEGRHRAAGNAGRAVTSK